MCSSAPLPRRVAPIIRTASSSRMGRRARRRTRSATPTARQAMDTGAASPLEIRRAFFSTFLPPNALGVSTVPVNPDYRHDELLYLMDHSEADLAVVIGNRVADLERVAAERVQPLPVVAAERWPARLP